MLKRGLGKGLGALIGESESAERAGVQEIEISRVVPNADQPRKQFDRVKLEELASSIREHGVVQPVIVRQRGDRFELVAGERRWRAAGLAGLRTIPAVVRELSETQVMEIALIENLQREDLNPMEEAEAFRRLIQEFGLTQEDLAKRLGKSRPQISNTMRLLGLSGPVREMVAAGQISMGHAKALMSLEDGPRQVEIARRIVDSGCSVREAEAMVKVASGPPGPSSSSRPAALGQQRAAWSSSRNPEVARLEAELRARLGTPVSILPGHPKGKIEISFFGDEDLSRLVELLVAEDREGTA